MDESARFREVCEPRFRTLEHASEDITRRAGKHEQDIAGFKSDIRHMFESLRALTRALWAVALSSVTILISFVVWYIQNL